MSNVWQTQHRLFLELLQKLAEWLSDDEPTMPAPQEDQLARILAVVVMLLQQHQVNRRGQCQFCGWTRWMWRLWRRRRRCTVHQALDLAMRQSLDVVWWCVFESIGRKLILAEVRAWLVARAANTGTTVAYEKADETTQDYDEDEPTIEFENIVDGKE